MRAIPNADLTSKSYKLCLCLASVLAFAFIVVSVPSSAASRTASMRTQTIDAVFSNPAPIMITDAPTGNVPPGTGSPYPSLISVSGMDAVLTHLTVTLTNVNHAFPSDLDILLVGPGGQSLVLQSDAGGNTSAVNRTYTFDDTASTQLPSTGGLSNGTFRATNHQGNDGATDSFPSPAPTGPYGNPGPQGAGTVTLNGTFGGTNPNGTWSLFVTDDEHFDAGNINGGWSVAITAVPVSIPRSRVSDYDGDNRTDLAVVRDTGGGSATWYINGSTVGFFAHGWGTPTDIAVPQDYDGDGKTDLAVWRSTNGTWYILQSATATLRAVNFGASGDDPKIVDDYDGDGAADPAVARNSGGLKIWYYLGSTSGFAYRQWGVAADASAPGDYDGDGKADFAVRRGDGPGGSATFYIDQSTSGFRAVAWGNNSDIITPGDYDNDNKTDIAVAHPAGSDLFWYVLLSGGGIIENVRWGLTTDLVTQGDYNGDSKTDIAVWRPGNGVFYATLTGTGGNFFSQWGQLGDYPPANSNSH